MGQRLEWIMSISREEFLRLLPGAVGWAVEAGDSGLFHGGEGSRQHWTLLFVPLEDLRLGPLSLPRHRIELRLEGYTKTDAASFLARFHRGFLRGGG